METVYQRIYGIEASKKAVVGKFDPLVPLAAAKAAPVAASAETAARGAGSIRTQCSV